MSLYRLFNFFIAGNVTESVIPTGGTQFGGGFTQISWSPASIGGEGGTEFGGSDTVFGKTLSFPAISGGTEFGGESSIFVPEWDGGGTEFGGSSTVMNFGVTFPSASVLGGVEFGGADTLFSTTGHDLGNVTGSGGTEFRGSATINFTSGITPVGGMEFGGDDSVIKFTLAMSMAGGTEFGGVASFFSWHGPGLVGEGGTEFGDDESVFRNRQRMSGSGGVEFGGANTIFGQTVSMVPEGGLEFGGGDTVFDDSVATAYSMTMSGGWEFGGASSLVGLGMIPSGGTQFGGDSTTFGGNFHTTMEGSGGTEFNAIATVAWNPGGGLPDTPDDDGGVISTPYHRGPTTRANVMRAIRRTLVATGQWTEDQVYIPRRRDEMDLSPPSEPFLTLFLGTNRVEQPDFTGGGLHSDTRIEILEVRVYHRYESDQMQRVTNWELDASRGAQRWVLMVTNALHGEEAFDAAGICTTGQPIRLLDIRDQQPSRQQGWGFVPMFFEVLYTAAETSA